MGPLSRTGAVPDDHFGQLLIPRLRTSSFVARRAG
jgi:hypothetical protein